MQAVPSSGLGMRCMVLASLLLALSPGWAAPKEGVNRPEGPAAAPVPNLLRLEPEELRLLQSYLASVRPLAQDPADMTREQVLLSLLALHDYDRSGQLDGLEFMQLLMEVVSQRAQGQPSADAVAVVVDGVLETQDLNRDGLLNPSELLLPPPARTDAPGAQGLVQGAPEDPERPALARELPDPRAAGPAAEQVEGPSLSRTGPDAAQPEEEAAGEAPGAQAPNAEI